MSEELMITKEDLVNWLNRPPSNDDLDLIGFITTRLENFYKLEQENKQLKKRYKTLKQEHIDTINRNEEKQQRIDKAIEYIKAQTKFEKGCDIYKHIDTDYLIKLLGGKNE